MLKTISKEVAALIGAVTLSTTCLYSTERQIYENRRIAELNRISNTETSIKLDMMQDKLKKLESQSVELNNKLDMFEQLYKEAINNNQSDNETLKFPIVLNNEINSSLKLLDKTLKDMNNPIEASRTILSSNENYQNYLFFNDDFNLPNPLFTFSTSLVLLSGVTLSSVMGLIINYYIKLYGEQFIDKAPKLILPLVKYYLKFTQYNNYYYIIIIVISQLFILLISIYLKFRGIA
jgi:hypothetical protein